MGLDIRFSGDPGRQLAYSVERIDDGLYFDFSANEFSSLDVIADFYSACSLPHLGEGTYGTEFTEITDGSEYMVRVHDRAAGLAVVAEMPVGIGGARRVAELEEAASMPQPSFRKGKKYHEGREISARYRYTFYGDDGYTVHTATLWEDGTSSCNCTRWIKQKVGEERNCPHAERALTLTANLDDTGTIPVPTTPPTGTAGTAEARRRQRRVDID